MNYLIFDVIIALILLFALWRGYSRGFILTLCGFLAIFVAFIGATVISDNLARPVADAIRPAIERQIQGTLEQSLQVEDSLASTGGEAPALEELPISEVLEALQESALYRGLAQAFQEAVDNGVAQVTTSAAKALAEYAAVQLARMVPAGVCSCSHRLVPVEPCPGPGLPAARPVRLKPLERGGPGAAQGRGVDFHRLLAAPKQPDPP